MAGQSRYETQEPRFTEDEAVNYKRPSPHVLIVGAGLAGLYLSILLEHANISYQMFERAAKVKPLGTSGFRKGLSSIVKMYSNSANHRCSYPLHRFPGAVLSLNSNILATFEQLNLYEDLLKIALPVTTITLYQETLKKITDIPCADGLRKMYESPIDSQKQKSGVIQSVHPLIT